MLNRSTFLIAACLSAPLLVFPHFYLAWLAIVAWGVHFYALHEVMTLAGRKAQATPLVLAAGLIFCVAFALLGTLYALMAMTTVAIVVAMRSILPQHFAVEGASQSPQ